MFSSIFSASDPSAPNLHPVSSAYGPGELFAPLTEVDLAWTCGTSSFATETQIFYNILDDGRWLMCQVIHSATGLWYPSVQFVVKVYNPATKEKIWYSKSVDNFTTPPPGLDKRSCKSDSFSITFKPTPTDEHYSETYTVSGNVSNDLQVALTISRPKNISGFKVGKEPHGGFTYFGTNKEKPDGYVVHRFWPQTKVTGHLIWGGGGGGAAAAGSGSRMEEIKGHGMMVNAIQGMRPNLIARTWNFCWFSGHLADSPDTGVSAIMMEFTTTDAHGRKKGGEGGVIVNVGCISVGDKVVVTGETKWPDEARDNNAGTPVKSRATHYTTVHDGETGYAPPTKIGFEWKGVVPHHPEDSVEGAITMEVGEGQTSRGLIEKVNVLAEIPPVLKKIVNMMGTNPYIYQWLHPDAVLKLHGSKHVLHGKTEVEVKGNAFVEASFVS